MTQQLPTGIVSDTIKTVLIGPGALIHIPTLKSEIERYFRHIDRKQIIIHPSAAIVTDDDAQKEIADGMTKIGSTAKGVGAAMIKRIQRVPGAQTIAEHFKLELESLPRVLVDDELYHSAIKRTENLLVEGAQGFSLSMYHGQYPYTTSRDVTPAQILADCAIPFHYAPYVNIVEIGRAHV